MPLPRSCQHAGRRMIFTSANLPAEGATQRAIVRVYVSAERTRYSEVSHTSIVLWVETIRADGCGPPAGWS